MKKRAKDFHQAYKLKTPKVNITNRVGTWYHITPALNIQSILDNGLRSSDGLVWFFDNLERTTILNVCLIKNFDYQTFGIIAVNKQGCTGFVTNENFKGSNHRHIYIKQSLIKPEFLRLQGEYNISLNRVKQTAL